MTRLWEHRNQAAMRARYRSRCVLLVVACLLVGFVYNCAFSGPTVQPPGKTTRNQAMAKTQKPLSWGSSGNVTETLTDRRQWLEKLCARPATPRRRVKTITGHAPAGLALCLVPKAACTLWLRLFTYLVHKPSSNRSITSYSKYNVHVPATYKTFGFNDDREFIQRATRAMTARNPYARLWSAYIDKFLLPDFWFKGMEIIRTSGRRSTENSRCGNNVTFPEFIDYVIYTGHDTTQWDIDYHWMPVSDFCDPCLFKPDYVVKQETFIKDFTHVLDKVGLLTEVRPALQNDQDLYEIETEIDFAFKIYYKNKLYTCVTGYHLAELLWKAMKLNGYIHPDEPFPISQEQQNIDSKMVYSMVLEARMRSGINKATKKAIRKKALVDAYRELSAEQLFALRQLYKMDFEMFIYDPTPPI